MQRKISVLKQTNQQTLELYKMSIDYTSNIPSTGVIWTMYDIFVKKIIFCIEVKVL